MLGSSRSLVRMSLPFPGLVVAGDSAYNDVHLYLGDANGEKRREWISALDQIESLNPLRRSHGVIRGPKTTAIRRSSKTQQYIRDFDWWRLGHCSRAL